ncbi:MAG: flagellar hook-basal body complex protein FliE [Candidatus Eisenbacteria bacterium]
MANGIGGIGGIGAGIRMPQELPGASANRAQGLESYKAAERALGAEDAGSTNALRMSDGADRPGFLDTAKEFVNGVNDLQLNADDQLRAFVRGEAELHDVAIATHEAAIAMRLTREIRDRLLGAYQEIMRTQM